MKRLALIAPFLLMVSCAGYQLGGNKPSSLARIKTIAVPMFANSTQHPRAESLATSAVSYAIVHDGSYHIASQSHADAVLEGTLREIRYQSIRGARFDTSLSEEFQNTAVIDWILRDARNPTKILASGSSTGTSQLFADSNLQTARNNALPEALEHAGEALVSRLTDGF